MQFLLSRLWGDKKGKKKMPPAGFKPAHQVLLVFQAAAGWGVVDLSFFPSCGFVMMGPGLSCSLHSCPASRPVPWFTSGLPVPSCAWPMPSVYQLCCSWGEPNRGNSHTTFPLFAVLGARHSQSLFRVVLLPLCVKCFWGLWHVGGAGRGSGPGCRGGPMQRQWWLQGCSRGSGVSSCGIFP